jgi:hypothetical protein
VFWDIEGIGGLKKKRRLYVGVNGGKREEVSNGGKRRRIKVDQE